MNTNARVSAWMLAACCWGPVISAQEIPLISARVFSPFIVTNDCIYQPIQTAVNKPARAELQFTVQKPGKYYIFIRGRIAWGMQQALWLAVDREPNISHLIEVLSTNGIRGELSSFSTYPPRPFDLAAGNHKLVVQATNGPTQLEGFTLVPENALGARPEPPKDLHSESP